MRVILWIFIGLVCLIPVAFITLAYVRAPSKNEYNAAQSFVAISREHVNNQKIDIGTIEGSDVNADYVRIFAGYLNKLLEINDRLAQVKNNLVVLAQPASIVAARSIYELQEKQSNYDKEITSIDSDLESATKDVITKMNAIDKSKIKAFDPADFTASLNKGKPERAKEIALYQGLSQYIKTMLEFLNPRKGLYQLSSDGSLNFKSATDQQYYAQLVTGINQYVKLIGDLREQQNKSDRKMVNDISVQ